MEDIAEVDAIDIIAGLLIQFAECSEEDALGFSVDLLNKLKTRNIKLVYGDKKGGIR